MRGIKYVVAMLAAGGAASAASSQAGAAVTVTLDIAADASPTAITLAGATSPQFDYGQYDFKSAGDVKTELVAVGPMSHIGEFTSTAGLPSSGESFVHSAFTTEFKGARDSGGPYLHLKFDANGTTYLGTALIDSSTAELVSIEYAPVPEPETWALLIAGAAVTGAALRRRRHVSAMA